MQLTLCPDRPFERLEISFPSQEGKLQSPIRTCQKGLSNFTKSTSKTSSLEIVFRIFHKTIKFFSLLQAKGEPFRFDQCAVQLKDNIDMLKAVKSVHLLEEFVCPDEKGLYLHQKANVQKCMGRAFLLGYYSLLNLKLIEKLQLARLPEITRIAIGRCPLLRLATDISYLLYRAIAVREGVQTGRMWQVAISISKIFTVTTTLLFTIFNIQATGFVLALTGIGLVTDVCLLGTTENWI